MTDRTWDAVVVGAGPAGAIAARELARAGKSVLLVDQATFPRAKVCGCCLNGMALAALDSIGLGHLLGRLGAVELREMQMAAGPHVANLRLPAGASISREALDQALVQEAEAAGATFAPCTRVKWTGEEVLLPDGRPIAAKVAILANGLAAGGDARPGSRLGAGTILPADRTPDFFHRGAIYMAVGRGGYVGLVRLEDDRLDAAAAFDAGFVGESGGLGPAAAAILATTRWPEIPELAEASWKGTPALSRMRRSRAGRRFFAIGDAAGYVEPFTGQGMAWAMASAVALAPIACRAIEHWQNRYIKEWERMHARTVHDRQTICRWASRVLRSPRFSGVAVRALALVPALARPVVASLNRPGCPA